MFRPKYTITDHLLANIKRINTLVNQLNYKRFPRIVLAQFEKTARAVSTYASTSIEGNPLPLTEVKKILKSKPAHIRESEREVLNYNQALQSLNKQSFSANKGKTRSLSLDFIINIHKLVMDGLLPGFELGKLRVKPVTVNDPRTGKAVYLPPDAKDVNRLMEDLVGFVNTNSGKIDPLILAGIFHKHLVIIHPFVDGNGRTTRLVTKVLLAEMGLDTFNLFSFENYYNKNVTRYFQTVGEYGNYYDIVDKIDYTPWLEYFTEGIIDELLRVQKQLQETGIDHEKELQPHHLKIIEFTRKKGFITGRDYAKITNRAKATRVIDFQKLIYLGLIERRGKGRATYYILKEV